MWTSPIQVVFHELWTAYKMSHVSCHRDECFAVTNLQWPSSKYTIIAYSYAEELHYEIIMFNSLIDVLKILII